MKSNLYFKLDLYAIENDSEFRCVCSEYPVWGYGVFVYAVSLFHRNNGQPINKKVLIMDVAHGLFTDNKEKVEEIINLCIELGLFKVTEDGKLYSSRVQRECQKQADYSEKQRSIAMRRWSKNDAETIPEENLDNTNGNTNALPTHCRGNANKQEQEQEQEQDNNNTLFVETDVPTDTENEAEPSVSTEKDEIPYQDIISHWNKGAVKVGLPQVSKMTALRKKHVSNRWSEYREKVYEAMDKVFGSYYLTQKWGKASFDWVFLPSNMVKVIEGNYDDKPRQSGSSSYGNNKTFRPKDITGRYDDLESEVIEV